MTPALERNRPRAHLIRLGNAYEVELPSGRLLVDVVRPAAFRALFTRFVLPSDGIGAAFAIVHEGAWMLRPAGCVERCSVALHRHRYQVYGREAPLGSTESLELASVMVAAHIALAGVIAEGATCLCFGVRLECTQIEHSVRILNRLAELAGQVGYR